ncbi:MAG: hypothetical protein AAF438_10465, partial [Pseudomonadota bacterium]
DLKELHEKHNGLSNDFQTQLNSLEADLQGSVDRLAELESKLNVEQERARDLSNRLTERNATVSALESDLQSRGDVMASLQDEVAQYTEVVESLQSMLAMKDKSNMALKRSVDNLRAYKSETEQKQERLSKEVADLNARLVTASKLQAADPEEYEKVKDRVIELEASLVERDEQISSMSARFKAQSGVVASMEKELEGLRESKEKVQNRDAELVALRAENDAKQQLIESLEADAKELSKAKKSLRENESETLELKSLVQEEQGLIESLQQEIEVLRTEKSQSASGNDGQLQEELEAAQKLVRDLQQRVEDLQQESELNQPEFQDDAMNKLMTAAKNQRKQIDRLQSEVNDWSRRYSELESEYKKENPTHTCLPKIGDPLDRDVSKES